MQQKDFIQAQTGFAFVSGSRGDPVITDGPFTESEDLIAGFILIDVKSRKKPSRGLCACRTRKGMVKARLNYARYLINRTMTS